MVEMRQGKCFLVPMPKPMIPAHLVKKNSEPSMLLYFENVETTTLPCGYVQWELDWRPKWYCDMYVGPRILSIADDL